jgi:hypothetical protein
MSGFSNFHRHRFSGWYFDDRFLSEDNILGRFRIGAVKGVLSGRVLSRAGVPSQLMLPNTRNSLIVFLSYDIPKKLWD